MIKQIAATGAAAIALPAWAQEKPTTSAVPVAAAGQVTIAAALARYAANLKYEDLPAEVVRETKRFMIDTIGCGLGGFEADASQIANRLAGQVSATRGATVMCSGVKTSADLAAFANGVAIRYLDFNDGYISLGAGHPSDAVSALLATAEVAGRDGRELIANTVLAYEVFCRVMDVFDNRAVGIDYATVVGLGATLGAGHMLGLDMEQMANAIGLYLASSVALNQTRVGSLSNWKAGAAAAEARSAVFVAQLAQAGMTGPAQVFEGADGFFARISRKPFSLAKLGADAQPFAITHCFMKRFSLGQFAQTVAQAAVEARAYFTDPSQIAEVNIRVSSKAIRVMADTADKWHPQTHETADHSMPYAAAVVLMYGTIEEKHYEDPYLHDQRLLDLVQRVHCLPSEAADRAGQEENPCDLEVVLTSGERHNIRVEYHRGHWKNPMTDAELEEKFRSLARRQLGAAQTEALLHQLWALDSLDQVSDLMAMTRA
ncbi:MAG TPA: MmgE/PrpD family protein [Xanthobacteraceae bacterium]|nr:MmgE/PrpD family protein [Xanthobacteraceae bacterium]